MVRRAEDTSRTRWLISQRWEQLLFAHWPVEARDLRPLLPRPVEPDLHDGTAWVAVVAFLMTGTRARAGPRRPCLAPIPELNVRTYVRVGDRPGVWFLSLDTCSPLFVAMGRALFGLRYRLARMTVAEEEGAVHYLSAAPGGVFAAGYSPTGPPKPARSGSLEHFLVERYRLFADRRGRVITAQVAHEPWPLQPARAEISANSIAPPGVAFRGEPLLHFSKSVEALISAPEAVRAARAPRRTPAPFAA